MTRRLCNMFRKPTLVQRISEELDQATDDQLKVEAQLEYYKSMSAVMVARTYRLKKRLLEAQKAEKQAKLREV